MYLKRNAGVHDEGAKLRSHCPVSLARENASRRSASDRDGASEREGTVRAHSEPLKR